MKYYELLEKLIDKMFDNVMTRDEFDEACLKLLDEVLGQHDFDSDWLAVHFNSTAEYIVENPDDMVAIPVAHEQSFKKLLSIAEREVEIFRKHGYDARFIEEMLEKAKEMEVA